jgi:patatin-like phospholipase/acyl hydrolase
MAERRFILSIDGGGMRGIIPAIVLAAIEEKAGAPASRLFDLIGGTSTGGLIALGVTKPGANGAPEFSAADLVDLYANEGETIFPRSLAWRIRSFGGIAEERYDEKPLEGLLRDRYFGETKVSEALTELVITAYDARASAPFIFKRSYARAKPEWDYPMWWAARATSAAPTYFEPFGIPPVGGDAGRYVLVDGGVFANNPALCAYVEALDVWGPDTEVTVCSLGTGERPARGLTKDELDGWGSLRWATTILDMAFDGGSDTVDYQLRLICRAAEDASPRYRRFQAAVPDGMSAALDNATPDQIRRLTELAQEHVASRQDEIDALCEELTDRRAPA